jgi:hypothetical protein
VREIVEQSGIIDWMTARLTDPRSQVDVTHDLASLIRTGVLLAAQGWRDHDDANVRGCERDHARMPKNDLHVGRIDFSFCRPDFEKTAQDNEGSADHVAWGQAFACKNRSCHSAKNHLGHQENSDSGRVEPNGCPHLRGV